MNIVLLILVILLGLNQNIMAQRRHRYLPKYIDDDVESYIQNLIKVAQRKIGKPHIVNFQEKKLAKMILQARDQENLITYTYIVNLHGELILLGQSIGYGLPSNFQYTNTQKRVTVKPEGASYGIISMPQAEPNGLFMSQFSSGSWILLIDPSTNKPNLVYIKHEIIVSPFKLR